MKLSRFAVDPDKSLSGVWWDFQAQDRCAGDVPHAEHVCLRIAAAGNSNYRNAVARLRRERLPELRAGGETAENADRQCVDRALAETILTGWANVDRDDGTSWPYSAADAYAVLRDPQYAKVRHFVTDVAGLDDEYRKAEEAEAKGN
jgi:hypothetical protein